MQPTRAGASLVLDLGACSAGDRSIRRCPQLQQRQAAAMPRRALESFASSRRQSMAFCQRWPWLLVAVAAVGCSGVAPEPTERDLRLAVEKAIRIESPLSGVRADITELKKIACVPAREKPGFVCDYSVRVSVAFHSNEGTTAGERHIYAVNQLAKMMNGGRPLDEVTRQTGRFVRVDGQRVRME